jgi:hypothetical protein
MSGASRSADWTNRWYCRFCQNSRFPFDSLAPLGRSGQALEHVAFSTEPLTQLRLE